MTESDGFAKSIAFVSWPFLAVFKMLWFFEYFLFFERFFCIEQLQRVVETFLASFFAFLVFDPNWRFCKFYSLWLVAIFGNFQNAVTFRILAFFGAIFRIEQLQRVVDMFLACFYTFLIFDPKWRFCKVYSLCLVAIFDNFQNALISQILAAFSSRFLHRTTATCCRNVFSMFLCICNFWPKVTILQSL